MYRKAGKYFCGISARSFSLSFRKDTVRKPIRWAARSFSLTPPMGRTLPRRVISPVMVRSQRTGMRVRALAGAVVTRGRAVLGDRAFGHVHVNIDVAVEVFGRPKMRTRANVGHGRLGGFLHDVAELAGEGEAAFASIRVASVARTEPPTSVQARPGGQADFVVLSSQNSRNFRTPRKSVALVGVTSAETAAPSVTTLRAILREMFWISHSVLRTPASWVWM